ncbi:hypothetical protein BC827DRAFT_1234000 [Russula dissimulans]|nr:hypothetical protein BC827DRAFT_1234000 [Russula dissimulans]
MGLGLSCLLLSCGHALTSRARARTFLCPKEAWNADDGWAATQRNSGLHLHTHCHRNPTSRRISILLPRMTFDFCKKSRSQAPVCDGWVVFISFQTPSSSLSSLLFFQTPNTTEHTTERASWAHLCALTVHTHTSDCQLAGWCVELDSDPDGHWPEASIANNAIQTASP